MKLKIFFCRKFWRFWKNLVVLRKDGKDFGWKTLDGFGKYRKSKEKRSVSRESGKEAIDQSINQSPGCGTRSFRPLSPRSPWGWCVRSRRRGRKFEYASARGRDRTPPRGPGRPSTPLCAGTTTGPRVCPACPTRRGNGRRC